MKFSIELHLVTERKRIPIGSVEMDVDLRDVQVSSIQPLSHRETQVRDLIMAGKVHKEIGAELGLAERTVKFHAINVYRKYGVRDRGALLYKLSTGTQKQKRQETPA